MNNSIFEKIETSLDLTDIVKKVSQNHNWNDEQAKYAYQWYLRHLYLCIKYPSLPIAAISKSADDLWHQHILDTRKYATDCNLIAGRFLNHTPIYGKPSEFEIAAYNKTLELYLEEFNEEPKDKGVTSGDYSYSNPNSEI